MWFELNNDRLFILEKTNTSKFVYKFQFPCNNTYKISQCYLRIPIYSQTISINREASRTTTNSFSMQCILETLAAMT